MGKDITFLIGSARKGGYTEILADVFIRGAIFSGHNVNKIILYNKKIQPCFDCMHFYQSGGLCALKDDMGIIYEALMDNGHSGSCVSGMLCSFSAQLISIIDRLHNPVRNGFCIKICILLSVCADNGNI